MQILRLCRNIYKLSSYTFSPSKHSISHLTFQFAQILNIITYNNKKTRIMKSKRPLSPHLQIYKPQLTSMLSITHRATGIFLSFGALALCLWIFSTAINIETYNNVTILITSGFGKLVLFGLTFSLFYHLCNGIRHLFWDIGRGFELPDAYFSGWLVVGSSITFTLIVWAFGLKIL